MLVRAATKSSKSLGQFAWFMRFAQLTAQDKLQLIDREQRHCLGWTGRVGLHAAQHPRLQNAHQGTGKKTAHQQVFISTNAGAQLASDLGKGLIQGTSQYIAKKMRTVKVHLKAGYRVMLYQEKY